MLRSAVDWLFGTTMIGQVIHRHITPCERHLSYIMEGTSDVRFVLDQNGELDIYQGYKSPRTDTLH